MAFPKDDLGTLIARLRFAALDFHNAVLSLQRAAKWITSEERAKLLFNMALSEVITVKALLDKINQQIDELERTKARNSVDFKKGDQN